MFHLLIIFIFNNVPFIPLLIVIINSFISLLHRFKVVFAFLQARLKMTCQTVSIFQTMFLQVKWAITLKHRNKIYTHTECSHKESRECLQKKCLFLICRFKVLLVMSEREHFKVPHGFH